MSPTTPSPKDMQNYTANQTVRVPKYGLLHEGKSADLPAGPDTEFLVDAGAISPTPKKTTAPKGDKEDTDA